MNNIDITNPYVFVNAITQSKLDLMSLPNAEKEYKPFLVNRSLSYFPDTIMYANEMNVNHHLEYKLQFDYLINTIRPRKRFSKWAKKMENDDLAAVKQYYQYNDTNAEFALTLLSPEQLSEIKTRLQKGGISNERNNASGN